MSEGKERRGSESRKEKGVSFILKIYTTLVSLQSRVYALLFENIEDAAREYKREYTFMFRVYL
jgi:hypothetical protein